MKLFGPFSKASVLISDLGRLNVDNRQNASKNRGFHTKTHCAVPENIHTGTAPTEGIGISWGMGGSGRSKNIKKCMKLYRNFQRGGEVLEKIPSVGEV